MSPRYKRKYHDEAAVQRAVGHIVTDDNKRYYQRGYYDRGLEVTPMMNSATKEYRDMLTDMTLALMEMPTEVTKEGATKPGCLPGPPLSTLTLPGYYGTPMHCPPLDNAGIIEESNLRSELTEREQKIWDRIFDDCFRPRRPAVYRQQRRSSTGPPFFETDPLLKRQWTAYIFQHIDEIIRMACEGNLIELFDKHGALFLFILGTRFQATKLDPNHFKPGERVRAKLRQVNSVAGSLGGYPDLLEVDYVPRIDGTPIYTHVKMRVRIMFMLGHVLSYIVGVVWSQHDAFFDVAPETYHHSPESIEQRVQGYRNLIGVDVGDHDIKVHRSRLEAFVDGFDMPPSIKHLLKMTVFMPFWACDRNVNPKAPNGVLSGDPFGSNVLDLRDCVGLPSGNPINTRFGKMGASWAQFCLLDEFYGDVLENWDAVKRHRHHYALMSSVDDALYLLNTSEFCDFFDEAVADHKSGKRPMVYLQEREKAISFLGVIFIPDREPGRWKTCGNAISLIRNRYCEVERPWQQRYMDLVLHVGRNATTMKGVDTRRLPTWFLGFSNSDRHLADTYQAIPQIDSLIALEERCIKKHFGVSMAARIRGEIEQLEDQLEKSDAIKPETPIEKEIFLSDGQKLLYRYDVTDVRPEFANMYVSHYPVDLSSDMYDAIMDAGRKVRSVWVDRRKNDR